jgi:chemotaxis protein MotB
MLGRRLTRKETEIVGASFGLAPWAVTLALAAIAGFLGYYVYHRHARTQATLDETRLEVARLQADVAKAEERAAAATKEVTRITEEYATREVNMKSEVSELEKRMREKEAAADELAAKLQDIISSDEGELVDEGGGQLTLHLMDKVLFRSGEADLTANGKKVLRAVGGALNDYPDKHVFVQGHTDDVPIARTNKEFKSNWELSATRALNVVHFLQDEVKVDPRRLAAVAFSQYRPVSRRVRARNRRIEIVLFPEQVRVVRD